MKDTQFLQFSAQTHKYISSSTGWLAILAHLQITSQDLLEPKFRWVGLNPNFWFQTDCYYKSQNQCVPRLHILMGISAYDSTLL